MDFPNSSYRRCRRVCWAHHVCNPGKWSTIHVSCCSSIHSLPFVCSRGCEELQFRPTVRMMLTMVYSNMQSLLIKSRPQRMRQPNKLVLRLLQRILPRQLLMSLNPNCPCQLQRLLVPPDPPSFSSSFVIFARTHKLVFVRAHSSLTALMTNTLQGLECFCSSHSLYV